MNSKINHVWIFSKKSATGKGDIYESTMFDMSLVIYVISSYLFEEKTFVKLRLTNISRNASLL